MKTLLLVLLIGSCLPAPGQQGKPGNTGKAHAEKAETSKSKSAQKAPAKRKSTSKPPAKPMDPDDPSGNTAETHQTPPKDAATDDVPSAPKGKSNYGRPAVIAVEDLKEFPTLPSDRQRIISAALAVAKDSPWLPYKFGGSSPADGGFDCSGAMFFVMGKVDIDPPRTSADQYLWVKKAGRLHEVSPDVRDPDHPSLQNLHPGDLLFWGRTYEPADGRTVNITHVALYLGHEKNGNAVMINATDGRSYRGTRANGYGVYDFRLPKDGNRAVFMGYGTPPGIAPWNEG